MSISTSLFLILFILAAMVGFYPFAALLALAAGASFIADRDRMRSTEAIDAQLASGNAAGAGMTCLGSLAVQVIVLAIIAGVMLIAISERANW